MANYYLAYPFHGIINQNLQFQSFIDPNDYGYGYNEMIYAQLLFNNNNDELRNKRNKRKDNCKIKASPYNNNRTANNKSNEKRQTAFTFHCISKKNDLVTLKIPRK